MEANVGASTVWEAGGGGKVEAPRGPPGSRAGQRVL